jgi:hypothetical protein
MKCIPSQLRHALLACTVTALSSLATAQAAVVYNFDDLNLGNLTTSNTAGQDGWYRDAALGGPDLQVVTAPSSSSTTNALTVAYGNTSERALRQFGSSFFTGSETNAQVSFTFQKTALVVNIQFALGNGSTPTSYINGNSPSSFSPRLVLANSNQFGVVAKTTSGAFAAASLSTAQSLVNGNWYTVVMNMDFTANSGNGSASVSLIDLTNNITFSNIVSGVNLGLTNNPATTQADDWNQAWLRIDQLSSGGPAGTAVFTEFSINPVPEPNTAATVAAAGVALMFFMRRRSRSSH